MKEKFEGYADLPVYNQTRAVAEERGERERYFQSHRADVACGEAIEESIRQNYSGVSLDTAKVMAELVPRFGLERINFVLANMVRGLAWDGRISPKNVEWAETVPAPASEERAQRFRAFSIHPVLLDAFASDVRKLELERDKPSVLNKLHHPKPQTKAAPYKQAKGREL